jgi:mono/diheme cytochrome c family protein
MVTPTETAAAEGDAAAGAMVWQIGNCGACHILAAAGSSGGRGPNLDVMQPTFERVVRQVISGSRWMPPFADVLTPEEIADVARYIVDSTAK